MANFDFDIGVIGGGAAGLTVTAGSSQLGAKTLLVEKEPTLGGDCLHFGCVPSKTLIKTAQVYHLMKKSRLYGLPPITQEPVQFKDVANRIRSVIATIQRHDSVERFCKLGARVEFGNPEFTDEHTIALNGRQYSARAWVIATGSAPAIPPVPGLNAVEFLTNREIFSLDALPESLAILGAGPIAMEMGQAFCRLGSTVHIIQRSGQILSKEDADVANLVMERVADEGIHFHLNTAVENISQKGGGKHIAITGKDGTRKTVSVGALLVALGRRPNTDNLGLEKIGVDFDHRGIKVDARLRTNHSHIYAPGDVNGSFQFTHAAGYEGGIVISNAVFHLPRKADYRWMPWCTYTNPEVASVGMNEKAARSAGIDYAVWTEEFAANDRALTAGEECGKIKMILDASENVIGVQIIGPHAGDLIGEWIAVLNGKVKLATLAAAVHPYPTLGEINKRVAGDFFGGKIFSERVKKCLKFFFRLKGGTSENLCSKLQD